MRHISFFLTTDQVRARTKTVTRRMGWRTLRPGTRLQAVVKGQGLRKGDRVEKIGVIEVTDVRREPLFQMGILHGGRAECAREGFPEMSPAEFIRMFCETHKDCTPESQVTRIAFRYVDEEGPF